MSDTRRVLLLPPPCAGQTFPTLTPAQIGRIAARGRTRALRRGEVLIEQGDDAVPLFVVTSGELEAVAPRVRVRPSVHGPLASPAGHV